MNISELIFLIRFDRFQNLVVEAKAYAWIIKSFKCHYLNKYVYEFYCDQLENDTIVTTISISRLQHELALVEILLLIAGTI